MKEKTAQHNFGFIKNEPLENTANLVSHAKTDMNNVRRMIKNETALLKETLDMLNEIQETLFDTGQGKLFDTESAEGRPE